MVAMLVLPLIAACLGIGIWAVAAWMWWRKTPPLAGRVYYALVALVAVLFAWFLDYWNLLGFRLG